MFRAACRLSWTSLTSSVRSAFSTSFRSSRLPLGSVSPVPPAGAFASDSLATTPSLGAAPTPTTAPSGDTTLGTCAVGSLAPEQAPERKTSPMTTSHCAFIGHLLCPILRNDKEQSSPTARNVVRIRTQRPSVEARAHHRPALVALRALLRLE